MALRRASASGRKKSASISGVSSSEGGRRNQEWGRDERVHVERKPRGQGIEGGPSDDHPGIAKGGGSPSLTGGIGQTRSRRLDLV